MRSFFLLLSVGLFLALHPVRAQTTGMLTGRITDTAGMPVPGAKVFLMGTHRGALSRPDGSYLIAGVRPGTYQVKAVGVGTEEVMKETTVAVGDTVVLDFTLQPEKNRPDTVTSGLPRKPLTRPDLRREDVGTICTPGLFYPVPDSGAKGEISGRVIDGEGNGIPDARIDVVRKEQRGVTRADGRFVMKEMQAGTCTLIVSAFGMETQEVRITVATNEKTSLEVRLIHDGVTCFQIETRSLPPVDPDTTGTITILSREDILLQ